jgi:hypothetical protein
MDPLPRGPEIVTFVQQADAIVKQLPRQDHKAWRGIRNIAWYPYDTYMVVGA